MNKKQYKAPCCATIIDNDQLMLDAVSVDTSAWGDQSHADSRSFHHQLWDDEEDE